MAKKTKQELLVAGLEVMGAKRVSSKSSKYICLESKNNRYWVGKSGAVRVGKTSTDSIPLGDAAKAKIIAAYEKKQKEIENG